MKILKQPDIKAYRDKTLKDQGGIDPILGIEISKPTLDHSHVTGHVRQVLDFSTNQFEGKVISAYKRFLQHKGIPLSKVLEGLMHYWNKDYSDNPIHPGHVKTLISRFCRLNKGEQRALLGIRARDKKITKTKLIKLYRKRLLNPVNIYKVKE